MKLNTAPLNRRLIVTEIERDCRADFDKLNAMGILPGTEVTLVQKRPTFVFQVYHSRFAIDDLLAGKIHVNELA